MERLSPEQITQMLQTSADFQRFWHIYTNASAASKADILWAEDFRKTTFRKIREFAELVGDPEWLKALELIHLGLYQQPLPPEFEYKSQKAFNN